MHHPALLAVDEIQRFGIAGGIAGFVLLFFGRKLFWFLVALLGFYAGTMAATTFFHLGSDWHAILIGVFCGIVGVLLVTALQKIALGLFGFFAGVFLVATLAPSYHLEPHWWWFLVGGILGAIIAGKLFQAGLIVLSSLFGSYLLLREVMGGDPVQSILFYALAGIGMVVQFSMRRSSSEKRGKAPPPKEEE